MWSQCPSIVAGKRSRRRSNTLRHRAIFLPPTKKRHAQRAAQTPKGVVGLAWPQGGGGLPWRTPCVRPHERAPLHPFQGRHARRVCSRGVARAAYGLSLRRRHQPNRARYAVTTGPASAFGGYVDLIRPLILSGTSLRLILTTVGWRCRESTSTCGACNGSTRIKRLSHTWGLPQWYAGPRAWPRQGQEALP